MKARLDHRKFAIHQVQHFSLARNAAIGLADLLPSSVKRVIALWPAGGIGLASLIIPPHRSWSAMVAAFSFTGFVMAMPIGRSPPSSLGFMLTNGFELPI